VAFNEGGPSVGQFLLVALVFLFGFGTMLSMLTWLFGTLDSQLSQARDLTGGERGHFGFLIDVLESAWGWFKYIFTTPIALAALIAIALLAWVLEVRWG